MDSVEIVSASYSVRPRRQRFAARSALRFIACVGSFLLAFAASSSAQSWGNPVWSDEFNGAANSPINPGNWTYDTGSLGVNNEVEYYCAPGSNTAPCVAATPNAYIDGSGHLIIQALEINSSQVPYSGSWTSARLKSQGLQTFQYGRLESSMSLPTGPGIWPAYWALGTNIGSVGWPTCGEMDFMENVPASGGLGPTKVQSTIHGGTASPNNCYCGANGIGKPYTFPSNDPNGTDVTTFHSYGAIWSPNMVEFYVDSPTNIFFVVTASDIPPGQPWDFNHPFFVLLNLAVGGTGSWPGPPNSSTPNPAIMMVDYVRWYQASTLTGPTMTASPITLSGGMGSTALSLNSTSGTGRVFLSCTTTAPNSACSITSPDPLDPYTVDFSNAASATATVSVSPITTPASKSQSANMGVTGIRSAAALIGFTFGGLLLGTLVVLPANGKRRLRRELGGGALMLALLIHPGCGSGNSSGGGGGGSGYSVTVSAYTVTSTGNPDSTLTIPVAGN